MICRWPRSLTSRTLADVEGPERAAAQGSSIGARSGSRMPEFLKIGEANFRAQRRSEQ